MGNFWYYLGCFVFTIVVILIVIVVSSIRGSNKITTEDEVRRHFIGKKLFAGTFYDPDIGRYEYSITVTEVELTKISRSKYDIRLKGPVVLHFRQAEERGMRIAYVAADGFHFVKRGVQKRTYHLSLPQTKTMNSKWGPVCMEATKFDWEPLLR